MKKVTELILKEDQEQILFVTWLNKKGIRVCASANGGSRHYLEAFKLKRMGVSPGFPDLFIPIPCGIYHGLFIEMKRKIGGKISESQVEWINFLKSQGYYAEVAKGFEEAVEITDRYFALDTLNCV